MDNRDRIGWVEEQRTTAMVKAKHLQKEIQSRVVVIIAICIDSQLFALSPQTPFDFGIKMTLDQLEIRR